MSKTENNQQTGPNPEDFSRILLNGKVPIERDWQQYCVKKRSLSKSQIDSHNVGNTCGPASNCIVLDIDDPVAFQTTCEKNDWTVPATFTVQTGSGKPHYYFQYPKDGRDYCNKACASMGFDIRGRGGQVVAPGSIHPDTGRPYQVEKNIPIAPAPQWLLDLYKKKAKSAGGGPIGAPKKYGATALANELMVLSCSTKGGRNDQLNKSAHALGQLVAGGELDQYQVEQALAAAAIGVGLAPSEVKATIASGLSSGMASPRRAPERASAKTSNYCIPPYQKNSTKKTAVNLVPASQIIPEPVSWIWDGYIARGKVHIIAGPPGHGKTTLLLGLLAILTIGGRWPDGTWAEPCEVAIWSGEDDPADTLIPRLLACGADLNMVHIVSGVTQDSEKRSFDPSTDICLLRESIQEKGIKMLVIDPIVSAVGGDSHKNAETRRALQPVVDLAADLDCAVYGVTHFTKGTVGRDPVERVTGSLAFGALTRIVTVAMKLPDDGNHPTGARLFARAKSNIGHDGGGFHYFLDLAEVPGHEGMFNTRVLWGESIEGTAKELIAKAEMFGGENNMSDDAMLWLQEILSGGPMPAKDLIDAGGKLGYSKSTLHVAKNRMGILSRKISFSKGWGWYLPEKNTEGPQHLGAGPSEKNSTQTIDFIEGPAKVQSSQKTGVAGPSQEARSSRGAKPSDEPLNCKGLGEVETPKVQRPTVLGFSETVRIFEDDSKIQQSDLWEVEI